MTKVLNLYCGIGGNRKLWQNVDVTAVEIEPKIARIYGDFFPDDTVIVADAHQYLLDHYDDGWDFIWSSPPCPTHSYMRLCGVESGKTKAVYPDMGLYQEIIFLQYHFKNPWIVENVSGYYDPLIPSQKISRHRLWSNFKIPTISFPPLSEDIRGSREKLEEYFGFFLSGYNVWNKRQILRNCVNPELGLHVFNSRNNQTTLKDW